MPKRIYTHTYAPYLPTSLPPYVDPPPLTRSFHASTCIISVYRITTLRAAADSSDPTWENTDAAVWSLLELSIGVLAACLPTLKPLFALALPRLFRSTHLANLSTGRQYGHGDDKYGGLSARKSRVGTAVLAGKAGKVVVGGGGGGGGGGAVVYVKDVDGDMTALRGAEDGGFGSAGGDIEMPAYQVSVTGGSPRAGSWLDDAVKKPNGIHTTTVVTQRVDSL